jgi:hypothetical protein
VSADLERDLGAWVAGALSRDGLVATHGAEVAGTIALHERMTAMAAGMPIPDADAGWAALVSKIEAPAQVVPLRRHGRRRRTVSLLVAATLVLAGTAFAVTRMRTRPVAPPSGPVSAPVVAPAAHTFFGPSDRTVVPPPPGRAPAGGRNGSPGSSGRDTGSGGHQAPTPRGDGGSSATDDPNDRDHGKGNDGSHDDHGGGNDGPSGSPPDPSHGHGGH